MRRRRAKLAQPGVSLFPFLAVLICTLGVLIVLLVLAVKSATIQQDRQQQAVASKEAEKAAIAAAEAEAAAAARAQKKQRQQEVIAELEDKLDLRIVQAEGFEEDRPRLRKEVAKARDYRAHLEREIAEIEKQAQQLVDEMKLLDSDLKSAQNVVDDAELKELNDRIAAAQEQLIQKRNDIEVVEQKKYAIVPYRGAGGTERVPVFVECRRDGLTLQPFGITLTQKDFYYPVAAGNPVDAALVAVRNYYQEHELTRKDQRPYPLLVIRPGGDQSYGLARQSLISWDDEFGYELVSEDKDLEFGVVDPQLQQEIRFAVEKAKLTQVALKKRKALLVGARGSSGQQQFGGSGIGGSRKSSGGLRASAQHGGFVRADGGTRSRNSNRQVAYENSRSEGQRQEASRITSELKSESAAVANKGNAKSANQSGENSSGQGSSGPNSNGLTSPTQNPAQNLANSRGANWALPTQTDGATGYVRPVTVVSSANTLTIRNVAGEVVAIPINENPTQAIDKMVNIIWQRIDSWGIAGSSAYWKPNLSVVVEPGSEHRFNMLKQMLDGSGLGVEEASR